MNDHIRRLGYFLIGIFGILIFYIGYLNTIVGPGFATDPHNRRLAAAEENVVRGTIYDRQGIVLAEDKIINGEKRRVYPFGRQNAHLLGFISHKYGRTGLEAEFDLYLLAMDDTGKIMAAVNRLLGRQNYGYDVALTVDNRLQAKAFALLGGRRGAVAALDPKTGAVLAMVSTPAFDPEIIDEQYDALQSQIETAPLLNRATRGAYPPGSVFKIITGAGALQANPQVLEREYECRGAITVEGFTLKEFASHGHILFNDALAESCNSYFGSLGLELSEEALRQAARSFGFRAISYNNDGVFTGDYPLVSGEVKYNPGTLPANKMDGPELASTAIGQGKVMTSPMQMALMAAGVANKGLVMKPLILEKVTAGSWRVVKKMSPEVMSRALSPEMAGRLTEAMEETVKRGTAAEAALAGIRVAGKTGSAQNPRGETHAWFVGFAPADDPRIAVAVVLENTGAGGSVAAPLGREIIREYLK